MGKGKGKGKTRKSSGKGNYDKRANDGSGLPYWEHQGASGRDPRQHDTATPPAKRKGDIEYQKILAQNEKMQQELQQLRGENPTPKKPRAHEVYVSFEGADVSLISLTRMLEVEEQERGYKGHARYTESKQAIQRCKEGRDQSVPPQVTMQKLDKVLEGMQKRKQAQQEEWEQLQKKQEQLDKLWQACKTEGDKIDDEVRDTKTDWEKGEVAAKAGTNAWGGKGKGSNGAKGLAIANSYDAQPERKTGRQEDHDGQWDDDDHWGEMIEE